MCVMATVHISFLIFFAYNVENQVWYIPPVNLDPSDHAGASIVSY